MKRLWLILGLCSWMAIEASAQASAAQTHLAAARAAAYRPGHDFTYVFDSMCEEPKPGSSSNEIPVAPATRRFPPRSEWYAEPAKVFDNLYFVGSQDDASWAVTTSEGIIIIDTTQDYTVEPEIVEGLKKLGLDPAQIKYAIVGHAHGAPSYGARFLQDRYGARIIVSQADWDVMAKSTVPAELKPKKDMVATDGMKLTLGDTSLTLYVTPGHTPGTISVLVPLRDGNRRHLGYHLGGLGADVGRDGVRYVSGDVEAFKTWTASVKRFQDLAAKAGADVFLTIHPHHDKALDKINALKFRAPGDPHPLVGAEAIRRHGTVLIECMNAQLAWRARGASN